MTVLKPIKRKTCKQCRELFIPSRPMQIVCSPACAIELQRGKGKKALEQAARQERKKLREAKEKLKTRSDWMNEAQAAFNLFIRLRDKDLPCISCQRFHTGQYHAGHYRTTAAAPQLRFDERNVQKQCSACNNHKSGNIVEYRINLVKRIGIDQVESLESDNTVKKWTIDQLKEIKAKYSRMAKGMR